MKEFLNRKLRLALYETLERVATTIFAACIVAALINPSGTDHVNTRAGGAIALVVLLVAVVIRVRLNNAIEDEAKEAEPND